MAVAVMKVRVMGVAMDEARVAMPMGVGLAGGIVGAMSVTMMFVMGTGAPFCGSRMRNGCNSTWPPSLRKWSISSFCWAFMRFLDSCAAELLNP